MKNGNKVFELGRKMCMRKSDWKDRMNALLKKKGWDIKDWRRATGLNQWQLES